MIGIERDGAVHRLARAILDFHIGEVARPHESLGERIGELGAFLIELGGGAEVGERLGGALPERLDEAAQRKNIGARRGVELRVGQELSQLFVERLERRGAAPPSGFGAISWSTSCPSSSSPSMGLPLPSMSDIDAQVAPRPSSFRRQRFHPARRSTGIGSIGRRISFARSRRATSSPFHQTAVEPGVANAKYAGRARSERICAFR